MDDPTRRCEKDTGIETRFPGAPGSKREPHFFARAGSLAALAELPRSLKFSTIARQERSSLPAGTFFHLFGEGLDLVVGDLYLTFQGHQQAS
jgi:hypothetical protein